MFHFSCSWNVLHCGVYTLDDSATATTYPAFIKVTRVENDVRIYECKLCDEDGLTGCDALKLHGATVRHKEKEELLKDDLDCLVAMIERANGVLCSPLSGEIAALGQVSYAPWKDAVHAELYRYITAPWTSDTVEAGLIERPLKRLRSCLQSERLVLLALAVWKGKCLRQMPPVTDYDEALEWMRSGWKRCKGLQRDSNAMSIVVSAVRQFLD
jgi:hypothetical protein